MWSELFWPKGGWLVSKLICVSPRFEIKDECFRFTADYTTLLAGIMTQRLAVILLSFILALETTFPQVDLAELSSLPEVWAHFEKHRLESPGITFVDFLNLHYGDSDHLNRATHDHHKLPFSKGMHRHTIAMPIVYDVVRVYPSKFCNVLMVISEVIYNGVAVPSVALSIWQPPKI